jgi:hypothetical protein
MLNSEDGLMSEDWSLPSIYLEENCTILSFRRRAAHLLAEGGGNNYTVQ